LAESVLEEQANAPTSEFCSDTSHSASAIRLGETGIIPTFDPKSGGPGICQECLKRGSMEFARRDMLRHSAMGMLAVVSDGPAISARAEGQNAQRNDFISLTDAGARGDGETDDTAALRDAIDRCLETGATLYVPSGHYRHSALHIAPKGRAGLRIVGEWAFDVDQATRGSFLVHDGIGPGLEFGGDGGPFPLDVEGICFVGNPMSEAGVRIVGRSSLHFRRCGWIKHSNAEGMGALHLTRTSQDFVGLLLLSECWFAYGKKGVLIDQTLTNVINIHNCHFLDVDRCILIIKNASCRILNVRDSHFENSENLKNVIYIDGSVFSFNFTGNYIEQNSNTLNSPLIDIDRKETGDISRSLLIQGNFFQKALGTKYSSIIRLNEVSGVNISSNFSSSGGYIDRYWCWIGHSASNMIVELPSSPNGVISYPIFELNSQTSFNRDYTDK